MVRIVWGLYVLLSMALLLLLASSSADENARFRLDQLVLRTVHVLRKCKVTHWAAGGTLFGAFLDHRSSPGDFDADLMMLLQDVQSLRTCLKSGTSGHLLWYEGYGGWRVKAYALDSLRVDIFVRYIDATDTLRYGWPALNDHYRKAQLPAEIIFPLRPLPFAHGYIMVPAKPHNVLVQEYGPYKRTPPTSIRATVVGWLEMNIWARIIPLANLFSPKMPY